MHSVCQYAIQGIESFGIPILIFRIGDFVGLCGIVPIRKINILKITLILWIHVVALRIWIFCCKIKCLSILCQNRRILIVFCIDFVDWIKQEYNTDILNSSFKSRIEWKRTANDLMEFSNAKNKR